MANVYPAPPQETICWGPGAACPPTRCTCSSATSYDTPPPPPPPSTALSSPLHKHLPPPSLCGSRPHHQRTSTSEPARTPHHVTFTPSVAITSLHQRPPLLFFPPDSPAPANPDRHLHITSSLHSHDMPLPRPSRLLPTKSPLCRSVNTTSTTSSSSTNRTKPIFPKNFFNRPLILRAYEGLYGLFKDPGPEGTKPQFRSAGAVAAEVIEDRSKKCVEGGSQTLEKFSGKP
ncbi:hypothetical protein BDZ91DRAFT_115043 [Kalaharituber pfeilii]|nr:hypothetical protein BDZ91DRAFT_115043 [Kalaharituber pfeilii]